MDTTAPQDATIGFDSAEMLERLAAVDPSEAPAIADDLARALSGGLDDPAPHRQLEAEFVDEDRP